MKHVVFLSILVCACLSLPALATEAPAATAPADLAAAQEPGCASPHPLDALLAETFAVDLERGMSTADIEPLGFFGPHCTRPSFTCNLVEGGLGFDCTCTYRCECAYCNDQLTRINCVLIENDGCFACPLPAP